jgi:S-adenosylmethionine:tRNA ribosyltransferase-isomerase
VGAGTFQPIKADRLGDHIMHAEQYEVSTDLISELACLKNKVTCVGTTTVRTLESLYWTGAKLLQNRTVPDSLVLDQWEPYMLHEVQPSDAFTAILGWLKTKKISQTMASTAFMIVPGYRFKITGQLITNFHQPGSSLLMLIAAFIGNSWKEMYQYALDHNFRFLSYGDSSLLSNTSIVSEY